MHFGPEFYLVALVLLACNGQTGQLINHLSKITTIKLLYTTLTYPDTCQLNSPISALNQT